MENMPRRCSKRRYKDYPGGLSIEEWRKRLALAPDDVIRKTFEATTQLSMSVEAENRLIPRQHYKYRFQFLREKRVNDVFHSDTFIPQLLQTRMKHAVNCSLEKNTDYMFVKPLKLESQSFTALQDFGR